MDIYKSVYNLIIDNDCVIIPNFGGFVANYCEAKIDIRNQEFYPPSKQIAFNEALRNNDGLLVNYICKIYKASWDEANASINRFVSDISNQLNSGVSVKFNKLGSFSNISGNLVFTPKLEHNLLETSFGLNSFNFPLLKSDKQITNFTTSTNDNKRAKKSNLKPIIYSLTAAAAIAGFVFISVDFNNLTNSSSNIETANILPIDTDNNNIEVSENILDNTSSTETTTEIIAEKPSISTITDEKHATVEPEEIIVKTPSTTIITNSEINRDIHVIAGSFKSQKNAKKLQDSLIRSGHNAQIIYSNKNMYRVSIKSFANKNTALAELSSLKESANNHSLWILF